MLEIAANTNWMFAMSENAKAFYVNSVMDKPMKAALLRDHFVMGTAAIVLNVWAMQIVSVQICLSAWMDRASFVVSTPMRAVPHKRLSVSMATAVSSVRGMQIATIQAGPAVVTGPARPAI